ncbi:hypothetical protein ACFQX8_23345 [Klenkia terrae]|uniref:hypothetical protein n=1 Tax=Klenkia terrae TaxID=1052259 RepID=UPI003608DF0B
MSAFLGVATGVARAVPAENVKPYVADTPATAGWPGWPGPAPRPGRTCPRRCGGRPAAPC